MTPMKAIRAKCLDCNSTAHEVKLCPCTDCALWPFRLGKNPNIKRVMSEEQKQASRERMAKMWEEKKGV